MQQNDSQAAPAVPVDDDRRLVDRAQAGDVTAFEALVRRYERWVFTLSLRMVGDPIEAEDMAQEVFLKAYQGLKGFRGESRFSTWLYAIASHHCLSHLETRSRRAGIDGPAGDGREAGTPDGPSAVERVADQAPRADALLERADLARIVHAELASLKTEHRLILILRDIQGLSYEEIASSLGLEMGTVRSRLHRARVEIKERLQLHLRSG